MIQNVIVDNILVNPEDLFATNLDDWLSTESSITMFTHEHYSPKIMVEHV